MVIYVQIRKEIKGIFRCKEGGKKVKDLERDELWADGNDKAMI